MTRTISWKANLTAGATVVTGSAALLTAATGVPQWAATVAFGGACALCAKWGRRALGKSPALDHLDAAADVDLRGRALRLFPFAPLANATWFAGTMLIDAPPQMAAALVAIGAAQYGVARGIEYDAKITPVERPAVVDPANPNGSPTPATPDGRPRFSEVDPDKPIWTMQQVLDRADLANFQPVEWDWIGPGGQLGIQWTVELNPGRHRKAATKTLSMAHAEDIAVAFKQETGTRLGSSWVQIVKMPEAGTYAITITNTDTMSTVHPYVIDTTPTTITTPMVVGYGIDGMPVREHVAQHWMDTGATLSGKTSLINVKRAHIIRSRDAVLWSCGVEKFYDSVGPWIEPLIGTGIRPAFDWIANTPADCMAMLKAALLLARYRFNADHHIRDQFRTIILEIDEASALLRIQSLFADLDGEKLNPSELLGRVIRMVGSAGIYVHIASQRGTNDNWGSDGGTISAQMGCKTVFYTRDTNEIGRTFDDFKLERPKNKGEYIMQGSTDMEVRRLRAPYIQEMAANKPKVHDGANTNDVTLALSHMFTGLDEPSRHALSQTPYATRAQTAEDMIRYIRNLPEDYVFPANPAAPAGGSWGAVAAGGDGSGLVSTATGTAPQQPVQSPSQGPVPAAPAGGETGPATTRFPTPGNGVGDEAFPAPMPTPFPAAATGTEGPAFPSDPGNGPGVFPGRRLRLVPDPGNVASPAGETGNGPAGNAAGNAGGNAAGNGPGNEAVAGVVAGAGAGGFPPPIAADEFGTEPTATFSAEKVEQRSYALLVRLDAAGDDGTMARRLGEVSSRAEQARWEAEAEDFIARATAAQVAAGQPGPASPAGAASTASTAAGSTATATMERPASRTEWIEQIITAAGPDGISRADILAALRAQGDDDSSRSWEQQVQNACGQLVQRGTVTRVGGLYVATIHAPAQDSDTTHHHNYTA